MYIDIAVALCYKNSTSKLYAIQSLRRPEGPRVEAHGASSGGFLCGFLRLAVLEQVDLLCSGYVSMQMSCGRGENREKKEKKSGIRTLHKTQGGALGTVLSLVAVVGSVGFDVDQGSVVCYVLVKACAGASHETRNAIHTPF